MARIRVLTSAAVATVSVTYGGTRYTCLQGHTSLPGSEAPNVPALWRAG
ncbi:carbohydrate-binding protein [Longispora albida]|nr:carbohydrate-binding protein [Longispora albida]